MARFVSAREALRHQKWAQRRALFIGAAAALAAMGGLLWLINNPG